MNFLKIKTTWTNAELVIIKICIAAAYLLVGAYFHELVKHYYLVMIGVFAITVVWGMYLWLRKMKNNEE